MDTLPPGATMTIQDYYEGIWSCTFHFLFILLRFSSSMSYRFVPWLALKFAIPVVGPLCLLLHCHLGRMVSVSLIVCINWRLESHLRGIRTKGTTPSFRSTATCNCCNWEDISSAENIWSTISSSAWWGISAKSVPLYYLRMSSQSGCSPFAAGRWAWNLHGSCRIHAFGPNSLWICFSATNTFSARSEKSVADRLVSAARRLRDRYVSVPWWGMKTKEVNKRS